MASPSPPVVYPPMPNMNPTIGPEEVGVVTGAWMFGMFTVQAYNYYQNFHTDSKKLRYTILVLCFLELTHVILTCVALYHVTVLKYGDPGVTEYIHPAVGGSLVISAIVGPGVQMFYANRIRRLNNKWLFVTFICWTLSGVRALSLFACSAALLTTPFLPSFVAKWNWLVLAANGISVTTDVIIAVALSYLLWERRGGGIKSTQQRIDSLMMFTINTGLITCFASTTLLIFFVTMHNFAWLTFMLIIPRLFANTLVASLNSRGSFPQKTVHDLGSVQFTGQSKYSNNPIISIEMSRQITTDSPSFMMKD